MMTPAHLVCCHYIYSIAIDKKQKMKKYTSILILLLLPFMMKADNVILDFRNNDWENKFLELNNKEIQEIEIIGLHPGIVLPKQVELKKVRNIYFKESDVGELPQFLSGHNVNLIAFYGTNLKYLMISLNLMS